MFLYALSHMNDSSKIKRGLVAAAGLALLGFVGLAFWSAERALHQASRAVENENEIRFTTRRLDPNVAASAAWSVASTAFRDAVFFQNELFICGPTGLWEYAPDGKLQRRYRVGLELPPAPLISIATGMAADATEPELYIATSGAGLLAYNRQGIRQILPEKEPYRKITAVLPLSNGRLLLGTEKNGVVVYDGKHLTPFHPLLANLHVTALEGGEASFWVGTIHQGVLHWHAGQVDQFNQAEGLPDPLVLSIAVDGERAFVGTPMGVAEFRDSNFVRVLASGFFANSLLVRPATSSSGRGTSLSPPYLGGDSGMVGRATDGGRLLVGTMDEGTIEVPLSTRTNRPSSAPAPEIPGRVQKLLAVMNHTYALTEHAFFALDERAANGRELIAGEDSPLTDRNISALAFDGSGRLWVGYFDRGVDILDANFERAKHLEDDHVYCVNRIVHDRERNLMVVGTANGLIVFDGEGEQRQVLGRREGLIADNVSDIALTREGMVLATSAGITTLTASGARSVYAFQGLVNNHVYALGASGSRVLAGTLGGLSVLENGRVLASFTTANSGLRHNWVTSIVPVGDDWFVGTYGAGILRLDSNGGWQSFPDATGPFAVNNNAVAATGTRVYAGTLGKGLYVYDRASGRWSVVQASLPSLNVTALAVRDGSLYIGTDNGLVRFSEQELRAQ